MNISFEPSYEIDEYDLEKPDEIEYHFYGSSAFDWIADVDFQEVYKYLSNRTPKGSSFQMFFVPIHIKIGYKIKDHSPQGVDAHWLGTYYVDK